MPTVTMGEIVKKVWLTPREVAIYTGLSSVRIRKAYAEGGLKAHVVPGGVDIRIKRTDVDKWLEQSIWIEPHEGRQPREKRKNSGDKAK